MIISNLIDDKHLVRYLSVFSADELFYAEWVKNISIRETNFNSNSQRQILFERILLA